MSMVDLFKGKAFQYSQSRPSYSKNYIKFLTQIAAMSKASVVADIGAGTGIHSSLIAPMVKKIYCIDNSPDMLKECEKRCNEFNNVEILEGCAENVPLENATLDYIIVAQAFHLMDINKCKAEFKRLLKKNGKVLLVWNMKDYTSKFYLNTADVLRKYCPKYDSSLHAIIFSEDRFKDFFEEKCYMFKKYLNDTVERLSETNYLNRALCASYSPVPGENDVGAYINELKDVFRKYAVHGYIPHKMSTVIYFGEPSK